MNANHIEKMSNRRLHYGIIIFVNNATIICYSKRHNKVKASSFGSEFITLRNSTKMIESLIYKLRCFQILVEGPAEIFCDNMSVVKNLSIPNSALNKRHNAIYYHRVRESQDAGILQYLKTS